MKARAPRLLFLAESFHPALGGGELHLRQLSRQLAASGFEATVLTRRGEEQWPREEALDGVRVLRVAPSGPGRRGKYLMIGPVLHAAYALRGEFDVLIVRGTRVLGVPGMAIGRWLGRPVVLQPEINGEVSGEAYLWGKRWAGGWLASCVRRVVRLRNAWMLRAEGCVAMSRAIRDEFLAGGALGERIHLIPHGVDTERFSPADEAMRLTSRRSLGLPGAGRVFIYTGRLLRGKGLETLVEAFALAVGSGARDHLVLVGAGEGQSLSVEARLRSQVAARGLLGRVTFAGRVDDVERWLQAADVFVFPSEFEALGISLIEAASCGLPCLGSRTGGIVDVIEDGSSGRLLPPGEVGEWVSALREASAAPRSALADWGRRGREIVLAGFDARRSLERYRELFAGLASARCES